MKKLLKCGALGLALSIYPASAGVILETFDSATWLAGTGGIAATETFSNILNAATVTGGTAIFTPNPNNLGFTTADPASSLPGSPNVVRRIQIYTAGQVLPADYGVNAGTAAPTSITFGAQSGNFLAAGFDYDLNPSLAGSGITITVNFSGGGTETLVTRLYCDTNVCDGVGQQVGGFFGFVSDMAVSSFTFTTTGTALSSFRETFAIDNLSFANLATPPSGVPEPATFGLAGLALLGLGLARRRRRA